MSIADKNITLEIVTPNSKVYSGTVESVIAPGTEGYFQILHNHAPFLSTIDIGEIKIKTGGRDLSFATSGGFAEVSANRVSILAETVEWGDKINIHRAEEAKKRAEERMNSAAEEVDLDRARLALYRSINRIKLARK